LPARTGTEIVAGMDHKPQPSPVGPKPPHLRLGSAGGVPQRTDHHAAQMLAPMHEKLRTLELPAEDCFEASLNELICLRVAHLHRNASAISWHAGQLRALDQPTAKITAIDEWPTAPCYSERERAALAWTELLSVRPAFAQRERRCYLLGEHFSEAEQAAVTVLIAGANASNCIDIPFEPTTSAT